MTLCTPIYALETSLMAYAAYYGRNEIIDLFIESFADKNLLRQELLKKLKSNSTPLYLAAQRGHAESAKKLLDCFETSEERLNYLRQRVEVYGQSPLDIAAGNNQAEVIEYFLTQVIPEDQLFDEVCKEDAEGRNPLLLSALLGNKKAIHALMKNLSPAQRGAYLQKGNPAGINPLFGAIQQKDIATINTLLSYCSKIFTKSMYLKSVDNEGRTALHRALLHGRNLPVIEALLSHMEELPTEVIEGLQAKSRWGYTPLHIAIDGENDSHISLFLNKMHLQKMDMGITDHFGNTPLHDAAEKGKKLVFEWYLQHAPQVFDQKSLFGYSPVDLALMYRQDEILKLLIDKGIIADYGSVEELQQHPDYGMAPIHIEQSILKDKVLAYLKRKNRLNEELLSGGRRDQIPPAFQWNSEEKRWLIPGLCMGLSFLRAFYASEKQVSHFYLALKVISRWDESLEALAKPLDIEGDATLGDLLDLEGKYATLGDLMEQWVNDLLWFQHDADSTPFIEICAQGDFESRFRHVNISKHKTLKQEGPLRLAISAQQLEEIIQIFKLAGDDLLIWGEDIGKNRHVVYAAAGEKGWSYYDSNHHHQLKEAINDSQLLEHLMASCFSFPRAQEMKLRFNLLKFRDKRLPLLRGQGNSFKELLSTPSCFGWSPLHKAQRLPSVEPTRELLNRPEEERCQLLAQVDCFQNSPLHLAVQMGSKKKIAALLSATDKSIQQMSLMQKNRDDYTPLMLAVINGRIDLVALLLQYGNKEEHFALKNLKSGPFAHCPQHYLGIHPEPVAMALYEILTKDMSHSQLLTWIQQTESSGSNALHYAAHNQPLLFERILNDLTSQERFLCLTVQNFGLSTPIDIARKREEREQQRTREMAELDAINLVAGTQGLCAGETEKVRVTEIFTALKKQQPRGIKFNQEKLLGHISGGNCSAMSLDFASRYLEWKNHRENHPKNTSTTTREAIKALAAHYDLCPSQDDARVREFRNRQEAFNCLEVDLSQKDIDFSWAKVQALANFYRLQCTPATPEMEFEPTGSYLDLAAIRSMSLGTYLLRFIAPAHNEKHEEYGHSMFFIKEPQENYFYDPNKGVEQVMGDVSKRLFYHLKRNHQLFDLKKFRFYKLST